MRIGLVSNFSKVQNVGCGKIDNNGKNSTGCNEIFKEDTMESYSERPEAVTYTSKGGYKGNLNNNVTKDNNNICDQKKAKCPKKVNLTRSRTASGK